MDNEGQIDGRFSDGPPDRRDAPRRQRISLLALVSFILFVVLPLAVAIFFTSGTLFPHTTLTVLPRMPVPPTGIRAIVIKDFPATWPLLTGSDNQVYEMMWHDAGERWSVADSAHVTSGRDLLTCDQRVSDQFEAIGGPLALCFAEQRDSLQCSGGGVVSLAITASGAVLLHDRTPSCFTNTGVGLVILMPVGLALLAMVFLLRGPFNRLRGTHAYRA